MDLLGELSTEDVELIQTDQSWLNLLSPDPLKPDES